MQTAARHSLHAANHAAATERGRLQQHARESALALLQKQEGGGAAQAEETLLHASGQLWVGPSGEKRTCSPVSVTADSAESKAIVTDEASSPPPSLTLLAGITGVTHTALVHVKREKAKRKECTPA